jgi:hypothetical protein
VAGEEREGPDVERVREVMREIREEEEQAERDEVPEDERLEPPAEREDR